MSVFSTIDVLRIFTLYRRSLMKKYFSKLKFPISIQLIFTALYSITVALFPVINKYLFDNILDRGMGIIPYLVLAYLVLIILNALFQYISRLYEWKVTKDFNIAIKSDLFVHIISLGHRSFSKKKPSEYLSIFNNDIEVLAEDYISAYIDTIKSVLNILVYASALFIFVDPKITIVVMTTSVLAALLPKVMQKSLSQSRKDQLSRLASYFNKVIDLFSGHKRVNAQNIDAFVGEHQGDLHESENKRFYFGKIKTQSDMLNVLGVFFIQLSTFTIVAYLLVEREITIGTGIAAFGYVTSFLAPIRNILMCINCINSTKDTVKETMAYMDSQAMLSNKVNKQQVVKTLEVSKLRFKSDQFSMGPISLRFEKGKKYAITGHSGSGKSTFFRMLDGSLPYESGHIYIDGQDLNNLDVSQYIFSVDQFEHLFQTDFINNISIFKSTDVNNSVIDKVLNNLNPSTRDRISQYDGQGKLSGGEKQIIYLMRMLLADKPVILLDESYASIDKKNIKLLKDFIMSMTDKIIIEITHDTSEENLSHYDQVIVIEDGLTWLDRSSRSRVN